MSEQPQPLDLSAGDEGVEFCRLPLADADATDFQLLLRWWERTRGRRAMPSRAEVDPEHLRPILHRLLIVEVCRNPPDFHYRLAGTQARTIHGIELTGRSVLGLVPRAQGKLMWNDCCEMLRHKQPQHVLLQFTNREGQPRRYRVLRVPLSHDGTQVDHIMVVQDFGVEPRKLAEMYREFRRAEEAARATAAPG
ncbi:MAG: PAS domain-containing protein [Alphaproteobacteria bacterium]|nr:PAS domain-containing protein [Alphaproteobacteria bacterium]